MSSVGGNGCSDYFVSGSGASVVLLSSPDCCHEMNDVIR
jgi:hypothetical protein